MIWPILSTTPALVTVASAHGVTPSGLIFVEIFYFVTGLTSVVLGHFLTMGLEVIYLGETTVWV